MSNYSKLVIMNGTVMTYDEALKKTGSNYRLGLALDHGDLYKIARGVYSTEKNSDPYLVATSKYPHAIITMDSAFYIHGLTDVIPDRVHLATRRNALRINDCGIRQHYLEEILFEPGVQTLSYGGGTIRVYSSERMLVELMRNNAVLPLDYYKEIINAYRRRIESLDIRAVEDYMDLFMRNEGMFEILQKEVL